MKILEEQEYESPPNTGGIFLSQEEAYEISTLLSDLDDIEARTVEAEQLIIEKRNLYSEMLDAGYFDPYEIEVEQLDGTMLKVIMTPFGTVSLYVNDENREETIKKLMAIDRGKAIKLYLEQRSETGVSKLDALSELIVGLMVDYDESGEVAPNQDKNRALAKAVGQRTRKLGEPSSTITEQGRRSREKIMAFADAIDFEKLGIEIVPSSSDAGLVEKIASAEDVYSDRNHLVDRKDAIRKAAQKTTPRIRNYFENAGGQEPVLIGDTCYWFGQDRFGHTYMLSLKPGPQKVVHFNEVQLTDYGGHRLAGYDDYVQLAIALVQQP